MSDKRQAILDAAQSLLAEYGFHGFSMKQLANKAGIAAGTVYLYFQDKEAVIRELHKSVIVRLGQEWFVEQAPQLPIAEQFQQYWLKLWAICLATPNRLMCKSQFDSLPPDSYAALVENAQQNLQPLFRLVKRAREQNLLKALPDEMLIHIWMEPCISLARKQVLGVVHISDDELRLAAEACWDAISR